MINVVVRRKRSRAMIEENSTSSSGEDEQPLGRNFDIGTKVRKKFSGCWFDGEVIEVHVDDKLWTVEYADGDSEDLNEDEIIRCSSEYNLKYNTK